MRQAYRKGLRIALLQWKLVFLVFFVSLLGGLVFVAQAWVWLADVLDGSLATRTLLTDLDIQVFIDIAAHHGASLAALAGSVLALAAVGTLLWIWINALVAAAVVGKYASLNETFRGGRGRYFPLLRLWVLATTTEAIAVGGVYVLWRVLRMWLRHSTDELSSYAALGGCVVLAGLLVMVIVTVHDHARLRLVDTGDGAGLCWLWACRYVLREWRAIPLTVLLVATTVLVWIPYQSLAAVVPATSAVGLTISLVWAELFMGFRALMRVWTFAAAAVLQDTAED